MLCAVTQLFECLDGSGCPQISGDALGAPRFLQVYTGSTILRRTSVLPARRSCQRPGRRQAPPPGHRSGIEELRDGVGWTVGLAEDERYMVLTAAGDAVAYVGFGACLPAP